MINLGVLAVTCLVLFAGTHAVMNLEVESEVEDIEVIEEVNVEDVELSGGRIVKVPKDGGYNYLTGEVVDAYGTVVSTREEREVNY